MDTRIAINDYLSTPITASAEQSYLPPLQRRHSPTCARRELIARRPPISQPFGAFVRGAHSTHTPSPVGESPGKYLPIESRCLGVATSYLPLIVIRPTPVMGCAERPERVKSMRGQVGERREHARGVSQRRIALGVALAVTDRQGGHLRRWKQERPASITSTHATPHMGA